ncbi:HAD family hydrolase [Bacillus wiedmannii]|uniref:HAD family hydrolase n=1 Tax=Bacillus wiedmannii TaxID=1890302 RepID=UPI0015CF01FE|nr:HAD family hydrolase [Bacillus wiedmannii]
MFFFDIDNTLINHDEAEKKAIIMTLVKFGLTIDNNTLNVWREISEEYYGKYIQGFYSFEEQGIKRVEELCKRIGISNTKKYNDFFNYYLQEYEKSWILYEDVIPVLNDLSKKNRLGIISNGDKKHQIRKLEVMKIIHFFEKIIISSEIGFSKPNEIIFKKACELANVKVNDCTYVGDNFHVDVLGSKNAGFKAIYLNRNNKKINTTTQEKTIGNLHEIMEHTGLNTIK